MFPSSFSSLGINQLAKKGTMVREMNKEAKTVVITAMGKLRMKSPADSGRNVRGKKAKI